MEKRSYKITMSMAMAALAALPWVAQAQGVGVGVGANANAGVAGGTTSGNITTGTSGNAATDVSGPRGVLREDPSDPNVLRNEASDMDGHVNDSLGVSDSNMASGTVKKGRHHRTTHGTVKTNSTTHGTVRVQ